MPGGTYVETPERRQPLAESVGATIDVTASVEEVFSVATDFEAYPEWNRSIKEVQVLEQDQGGRATTVRMRVDAKIRLLSYTLRYDYEGAPARFSWFLVDGDVKELEGSYRFDRSGDVTKVEYRLKVDPGFPVPSILRRQAERQIVRTALEDLKKRVEAG